MQIQDIIVFKINGHWSGSGYPPGDRVAHPLDIYPEFNQQEWDHFEGQRPIQAQYVEIQTDRGISGLFGPIDTEQAFIISHFLRPFLIGRDPLANELLLDQMLRMHRHGRSGLFVTGVSAIDCALWDLKGKVYDQPIYRLLGGPTRPEVPAYASMLGFSIEPEAAAKISIEYKEQGYTAQKWFFRYGPADGEGGRTKNIALAFTLREALGPQYRLMFDAFMGWDLPYAIEMVKALETVNPFWMEEPIPPERVGGFREIRQASRVPIATGEHVYTRWQVKELLERGAVDLIQTDPDWTGGITELTKICALCSAYELPMIAHGHSLLAALHVAGAQPATTVPMVEYLIRHQAEKQYFHKPVYAPQNGAVKLPVLPGLGIVLDEEKIEKREKVQF
jgi:L-alanine-DL-glutamate epimerase-like enolase superfamily enzyme